MWISKLIGAFLLFFTLTAWAAVDINTASTDDLVSIKGIGPGTSEKIMTQRKLGKFKNWNDLIERVSGIGNARANKLSQEGLTVNGDKFKGPTTTNPKKTAMSTEEKTASSASTRPSTK